MGMTRAEERASRVPPGVRVSALEHFMTTGVAPTCDGRRPRETGSYGVLGEHVNPTIRLALRACLERSHAYASIPVANERRNREIAMPKSKQELEHELETLKLEYSMLKTGLHKGMISVIVIIIALASTLSFGAKAALLNGNQYLVLVGIVAAGILVYFSFVFGRGLKLKAKVSQKIQELEVSTGKKVR